MPPPELPATIFTTPNSTLPTLARFPGPNGEMSPLYFGQKYIFLAILSTIYIKILGNIPHPSKSEKSQSNINTCIISIKTPMPLFTDFKVLYDLEYNPRGSIYFWRSKVGVLFEGGIRGGGRNFLHFLAKSKHFYAVQLWRPKQCDCYKLGSQFQDFWQKFDGILK